MAMPAYDLEQALLAELLIRRIDRLSDAVDFSDAARASRGAR